LLAYDHEYNESNSESNTCKCLGNCNKVAIPVFLGLHSIDLSGQSYDSNDLSQAIVAEKVKSLLLQGICCSTPCLESGVKGPQAPSCQRVLLGFDRGRLLNRRGLLRICHCAIDIGDGLGGQLAFFGGAAGVGVLAAGGEDQG
jgi:hypothetical protein